MGWRALITILLLGLIAAVPAAHAQAAGISPPKFVSTDRDTVLRDGLTFRQTVSVPGFVSWEAHLVAAKGGTVTARAAGSLVTAVLTREVGAPGTQRTTLRLTARGARLVRSRRPVRLVLTTTLDADAGPASDAVVTRSITLR